MSFWCFNNALAKRERLTAKKKQSKSSTTNMPLNLLMVSTSPYSSSLQLAIKLLMGVDLWCSCSAGQVTRSHIKTYTISYFQWSLTHRKDISFFLFSSVFNYFSGKKNQFQVHESDFRSTNSSVSANLFHQTLLCLKFFFLFSVLIKGIQAITFLKMSYNKKTPT